MTNCNNFHHKALLNVSNFLSVNYNLLIPYIADLINYNLTIFSTVVKIPSNH